MKVCKTCSTEKPLKSFGKSKRHKDGLLASCKDCISLKRKNYFDKNPKALEAKRERERNWKKQNPEKVKANDQRYRDNNKESIKTRLEEYAKDNQDKIKEAKRKYERNNPQIRAEIKTRRRAAERKAIPSWSERDKIKVVYEKARWLSTITGLNYHVDHIIPIQGKDVCGLHVWSNLQILEASLNCSKQDKYDKGN